MTDVRRSVQWYHPGEVVIVARVPRDKAATPAALHDQLHRSLQTNSSAPLSDGVESVRSYAFDAPGVDASLVFVIEKLAAPDDPKAVRDVVEHLLERRDALGGDDVEIISVMPHVHLRAHEDFTGGSPGSLARPVYPDQVPAGWRFPFYQPVNPEFDLAHVRTDGAPVPVAVLDTRVDLRHAAERGRQLGNGLLVQMAEWLQSGSEPDARYDQELAAIAQYHASASADPDDGEPAPYPMADHALFVASLIHGIAPSAPLTLEPVLDDMGLGDLSLLLLGLQRVLSRKQPEAPQIVNLSLGFLPHPARLPSAWLGLPRAQDADYLRGLELFQADRNHRWVAAHRAQLNQTVDLIQAGLAELGRYLSLNNCLVIAAAGNDSAGRVEAHQARMEPRLPARFETVLGVAATTSNPRQPAPYSNVGDERELGDHVATFGGNVGDGLEPEDGVLGMYAGSFPAGRPNETGWAWWSGTSFATAIVSGIAANFWRTTDAGVDAASVLADLHALAMEHGPYVPALRTPSIEVRTRWAK